MVEAQDDVSKQNATSSATAALKPDFQGVDKEAIEAMLSAQTGGTVEVYNLGGGSESSGASSGISIFDAKINGVEKGLVLRFAPMDSEARIFKEYNIEEQYYLHKKLSEAGLPVPKPIALDIEQKYLPLPGFVMERVEGVASDQPAFSSGLFADPAKVPVLADELFRGLGQLHAIDWKGLGLDAHCCNGGGATYIEQYINWFWTTAEWAKLSCLEELNSIRQWLIDNQPLYKDEELSLVHGDTNLGNYMFNNDKLAAIIDWEMPAIAHRTLDVAQLCSYLEHCRRASPPEIQENIPSVDEWKSRYEEVTGGSLADFDYYSALVRYCGIVILSSMGRSMPAEHQAGWTMMIQPLWNDAQTIIDKGE